MYNTILVPLDGSKRAEQILKHVEELARCFNAKIFFLQVVKPPHFMGKIPDMMLYQREMEQRLAQTKSYLNTLKGEFREKGIKTETCVTGGSAVRSIIECVEDKDIDLVAMTSHGRTGLARTFYGSVTAGVLHLIDRPLLIIRSQGDL